MKVKCKTMGKGRLLGKERVSGVKVKWNCLFRIILEKCVGKWMDMISFTPDHLTWIQQLAYDKNERMWKCKLEARNLFITARGQCPFWVSYNIRIWFHCDPWSWVV